MRSPFAYLLVAVALTLSDPGIARAGMPVVTLSDVARMRVQTISFFLAGFLLSAWAIQRLWNYLAKDLTFLPRLTYRKSLGLTALWGLLFVLVLTMISGARELMTPGAWEKQGATYRLVKEPPLAPTPYDQLDKERQEKLQLVRAALWAYADKHEGAFPLDLAEAGVEGERWLAPGPSPMPYRYVSGAKRDQQAKPLVYEPGSCGDNRFVLLTDGDVRRMEIEHIAKALAAGATR